MQIRPREKTTRVAIKKNREPFDRIVTFFNLADHESWGRYLVLYAYYLVDKGKSEVMRQ